MKNYKDTKRRRPTTELFGKKKGQQKDKREIVISETQERTEGESHRSQR